MLSLTWREMFPSVLLPMSSYSSASGNSPMPTLSRTITMARRYAKGLRCLECLGAYGAVRKVHSVRRVHRVLIVHGVCKVSEPLHQHIRHRRHIRHLRHLAAPRATLRMMRRKVIGNAAR